MKANKQLNHSSAHLLAAAVLKLFPNTKLAIGPSIEEGFYYDFEFENPITDADLVKIERQMKKIASGGYKIEKTNSINLANQPYKLELKNEFEKDGKEITYYGMINPSNGESIFTDLCAGGHIDSISSIKNFKLLSLAGAYWRGDSNNIQLTRIYGTSWETKEELDAYMKLLADRKERDHRKIGKDMNIFMFSHLTGQGFPIWLEDGTIVKNKIQSYLREAEKRYGFREVQTPSFGSEELYKTSGHLDHYKDDMFPTLVVDNERLVMRPMTCPHHVIIYSDKRRSYKELPIRMSEHAKLYRYEKSGALNGLERVRSMELTDSHIFARRDQISNEFKNAYALIQEVLKKFNIKIDYISLSLRDPKEKDKFYDNDEMWNDAENQLRNFLNEIKVEYKEVIGEAAFYGPKIDIQVKTALGHEITMSTLQLDFLLPEKFNITYIDDNDNRIRPVIIHRGLIGTYERFIAILLEQTKGDLPFWISPRQVTIIPISHDEHLEYATKIAKKLENEGLSVKLDDRNERLAKKIREAQKSKTKFQIVIGDKEIENNNINVRAYGSDKQTAMKLEDFIKIYI
ncbi:MAG: threonine--tRNA ligase [Mycoplasmatales bacterium]|nr:threonine--tRNA ligase [Mycoplasmatales bacterium]